MLEYIHAQNLQSHKDSLIEFDPGINVIIGDNNAGKTSLAVRALYLLAFNPRGYYSHLMRHQKHHPIVEIGWNGHTIIRNRKGYILDGREYYAIKDVVPADITTILNLHPINFKIAKDELFLISLSPGARARLINQITGLDTQEVLSNYCTNKIKQLTDIIKIGEHNKKQLVLVIDKLKPIKKLENEFAETDKKFSRLEALERKIPLAQNLLENLIQIGKNLEMEKKIMSLIKDNEEAKKLGLKLSELNKKIFGGKNMVTKLNEEEYIEELDEKTKSLADIKEIADKLYQSLHHLMKKQNEIWRMKDEVRHRQVTIPRLEEEEKNIITNINVTLRELGTCPICRSKIK